MKTLRLVIHGRVQGVWYRESMRLKAEQLGITGWVRNREDGTVEAVVQGDHETVSAMLDWARVGPPQARVTRLDAEDTSGEFLCFEKRVTSGLDPTD
jgi:acylphosphatase